MATLRFCLYYTALFTSKGDTSVICYLPNFSEETYIQCVSSETKFLNCELEVLKIRQILS